MTRDNAAYGCLTTPDNLRHLPLRPLAPFGIILEHQHSPLNIGHRPAQAVDSVSLDTVQNGVAARALLHVGGNLDQAQPLVRFEAVEGGY
jgi:hypothetical protein